MEEFHVFFCRTEAGGCKNKIAMYYKAQTYSKYQKHRQYNSIFYRDALNL